MLSLYPIQEKDSISEMRTGEDTTTASNTHQWAAGLSLTLNEDLSWKYIHDPKELDRQRLYLE